MRSQVSSAALNGSAEDSLGEIIDALDGLCVLQKRSPTLEGSAPVKAVQFCTPFLQGNAAGFQVLLADSALVRRTRGSAILGFADHLEDKVAGRDYEARIARLVQRGLLAKNGYWHRKLGKTAYWLQGGKLYLWTGFLVRSVRDVWLLVTGAFNRRCSINVDEHVIPDAGAFVPLVVRLDLASAAKRDTWLEKELACIVPLQPDVQFSTTTLEETPEVSKKYVDYFGERWDTTGPGNYLGGYRKLTAKETSEAPVGTADCKLVIAGGANIHRLRTFDRFATPAGWSKDFPGKERLHFVDVRNIFDVQGVWDGDALRDLVGQTQQAEQRLLATWTRLHGEAGRRAAARFVVGYVRSTHGPRIGEPYLAFTPWVFVSTPPGWSSLVDGVHFPGVDGLRGVISTDQYHTLFEVWQFTRIGRFRIRRGASLLRVLPIPRRLLQAGLRNVTADQFRRDDEVLNASTR